VGEVGEGERGRKESEVIEGGVEDSEVAAWEEGRGRR